MSYIYGCCALIQFYSLKLLIAIKLKSVTLCERSRKSYKLIKILKTYLINSINGLIKRSMKEIKVFILQRRKQKKNIKLFLSSEEYFKREKAQKENKETGTCKSANPSKLVELYLNSSGLI